MFTPAINPIIPTVCDLDKARAFYVASRERNSA